MNGSTARRMALLLVSLAATPLALAQELVEPQFPPFAFLSTIIGLGALIAIGIVAIVNVSEYKQNRERLATIERIASGGNAVPPELLQPGPRPVTLAQERRRDLRRGITLLAWAIAVALIPIIGSGGNWRYGVWGLLFLLPSLGSFLKAYLTAREIARGAPADGRV